MLKDKFIHLTIILSFLSQTCFAQGMLDLPPVDQTKPEEVATTESVDTQIPEESVEDEESSPSSEVDEETEESIEDDFAAEEEIEEDDGLISINFQNTDINQVIEVLGDITGKIIIPPEELTGEITIVSADRLEPDVVSGVLKSAMLVKGYTVIETNNTLKVVPIGDTKQTNVSVRVGATPNTVEDEDMVITQVMPLKHASALNLKTTLQPLIGKHGNILANERMNTLIITDLASNIKRLATIIEQMEQPVAAEMQVRTFVLNYGDAETIAEILNDLSKEAPDNPYPSNTKLNLKDSYEVYGEIQAFAEKETNSIVVASAPVNFPALERILKDLDVFPPQAMIEVVIMDVTLDDDFDMGIEFSDSTTPSLTTAGLKADFDNDKFEESTFHSLLGLATDAATAGFTYRILNSKQTVQALAFILQAQENSKVLSTPKIMASNNEESSITVGQEIPIIESSVTDLSNNVTNVDFRYEDVGLILKVTPRISRDDYVNLKVHAELTDLSAQTILNASVINKREADANVIIPDRHTVILGGLMRDNNSLVESKIPYLGDIPVLGILFKKTTTALFKTELLIFITPHIIKNTQDLMNITAKPSEKLLIIQNAETSRELEKAVKKTVGYKDKKNKKIKKKIKRSLKKEIK